MRKKQMKILIGSAAIVGILIAILVSVSSDNLTYYFTPTEVLADIDSHRDQTVRVMGLVEKGSIDWIPAETKLTFFVADSPEKKIQVEYFGARPDMFKEGQGVVIEGTINSKALFSATSLFVKHTEEYQVSEHSRKKSEYLNTLDL